MQPFQVPLRPSKRLRTVSAVLHLCALILCFTAFQGPERWLGAAAAVAAFAWSQSVQNLKRRRSIRNIRIDATGSAVLEFADRQQQSARLSESSLIHRRGCFLEWQADGKTVHHAVLPDMTDAGSYRRLTVWARFGRSSTE